MAAISKDFVVKNGIVIEGDSEVTSSTNQIDALQVDGGAAIAKNLIVGTTATILGNVFLNQPLLPLSRNATLGSPDNPFSELYLRGNSLYIDHVVITSTGTDLTVSSTIGSSVVHAGSLILSNIASSNSPSTGALQVAGGAGIGGNLYVGLDAELQQTLSVTGTSVFYSTISVAGIASFNNTAPATSMGAGAVQVTGGARLNNNLVVMSTASNTGTLETNAVYVEGGVGIKGGLAVSGSAVFKNDVYFQGSTTYVYSTNTVYTDNLIELHVPPTGAWTFDDGKDIGFRFRYYNNADWNAALIVANDSKKLEFYKNGSEVNGSFVGVYGDFKTGTLQLVGNATSVSTTTGALTVAGGVGIAGNLFVAGGITGTITQADNLTGGVKGSIPVQSSTGTTIFVDPGTRGNQVLTWDSATFLPKWGDSGVYATTASNIAGGYPGSIVYQLTTGSTAFLIGSSSKYMLTYNTGTHAPQWTNPIEYTVGYANTATTSTWASTASYSVYASSATYATTSSQANYALFADSATTATTSTYAFTATYANIAFTATYANIAFTSTYANIAFTSTYADIASTATYANTSNYAVVAGTSTYANTSNYALVASTSTYADIAFTSTYANTSNYALVAGTSTYADIAVTSTYANTSNYAIVAGTSTYASIAGYVVTSTYASTSTNIAGGTPGSILYQSTTGTTTSLPLGNAGELLSVGTGSNIKWMSITGLSVGYATTATTANFSDNIKTISQYSDLTYYPTFVTDNNTTATYEAVYTTSSFRVNPRTGAVNIGGKVTVGGKIWANTGSSFQALSTNNFSIDRNMDPSAGAEIFTSLPTGTVWRQRVYTADDKIWLHNDRKAQSSRYINFDSFGSINFGDAFILDREYVSLHADLEARAFQINVTNFANFPTLTTSTWIFDADGGLTAPGKIFVSSTASSTSTTTGALAVVGGVGIRGDVYVGGDIYTNNQKVITTTTINSYANQTAIFAGTDTAINTSTGNITIWNTSTLQSVTNRGNSTTNTISITNTTSSNSTTTGALTVSGGVGIGGALYVNTASFINGAQIITTATVNQYASQTTIFAGTDTAVSASTGAVTIWNTGTLQTVTGRGASTTNQLNLNNGIILGSTANNPIMMNGSYSQLVPGFITANGTLVGTIASTNIYAFNYQHTLAPVTTATISNYYGQLFLPTLGNTANYSSMYGSFARIDMNAAATSGSVTTWTGFSSENPIRNAAADVRFTNHYGFRAQDPSAITATNVIGFTSLISSAGGGTRYNIYASGSAQNRFTGWVGIGKDPTVALDVVGQVLVSNTLTVSSTVSAYSTTTGALQVVGGIGVADSVYVGNRVGFVNTGNVSTVYQYYNAATGSLDTVFG